ncbi:MucBP domain-containing protein [Carnobacterium maltaromaticum]|uniref:MucBP domain-containing protein n=1 Tax=Carnobacterium maltaromaticum TaxID=2751 RepID=UPI0039B0B17D
MMKKSKWQLALLILISSIFGFSGAKLAAADTVATEGLINVGENLQLSYYFGTKIGSDPGDRLQVANVNIKDNGKVVQHLYGNGSNTGYILMGFDGKETSFANQKPSNMQIKSITGSGLDTVVTAIYTVTYGGENFEITSTITPRGNNLIASDKIKNISGKDLKQVWIGRSYDTMLNGNDRVPVKYIGGNTGLYIAQDKYKLAYNFHLPNGPEAWKALAYSNISGKQLFPQTFTSLTDLGQAGLNAEADAVAFDSGDSAIAMKWQAEDFPNNSTREISYIIGVTPENIDAPEVTVEQEEVEYRGGDLALNGTVLSKDPSVTNLDLYYQVDGNTAKKFKTLPNNPVNTDFLWELKLPADELTGTMPKQINIYAIDSNGYYSDSVSVDLVLPKSQPVTIEYKNQEGATLKASAKIEKKYGEEYDVETDNGGTLLPNFDYYTIEALPGNKSGTVTDEPQTVVIKYLGDLVGETTGKVTAQYINQAQDELTTEIPATGNGRYGSPYSTVQKDFSHYDFVEVDPTGATQNGTYSNTPQTVKFKYKGHPVGDDGKVHVTYINQEGVAIADEVEAIGDELVGSHFTTVKPEIENYEFKSAELDGQAVTEIPVSGIYTMDPQFVTYHYQGQQVGENKGQVKVRYVNQEGVDISPEVSATGNGLFGSPYTTEEKEIDHYQFIDVDPAGASATGFYTATQQIVTYRYQGEDVGEAGKITVNYKNQAGTMLATESFTGIYGQTYNLSTDNNGVLLKEFEHYTRNELPGNAVGTITDVPQTITLTYTGDQVGNNIGRVTAKYLNQEGVVISPEVEANGDGLFGSPYTTEQKVIENYEFVGNDVENAPPTGFYKETPQTVIYRYQGRDVSEEGKITIEYRNQIGKLLDKAYITGHYGQTYNLETDQNGNLLKTFEHYTRDTLPENASGTISDTPQTVIVTYTGNQVGNELGQVTVRYVNQEGATIAPEVDAEGDGLYGSPYTTKNKTIANYDLESVDVNGVVTTEIPAKGHYSAEPQLVTYTYKGQEVGESRGKVIAKYINQEGVTISPENPASGNGLYGSPYTTEQKDIPHYEFVDIDPSGSPATGLYSDKPQTVIYRYKGEDVGEAGKITIEYRNQAGTLLDTAYITGIYGQPYNVATDNNGELLKDFDHYTRNELPGNSVGTVTDMPQTVVITYTGELVGNEAGAVVARYINQEGVAIAEEKAADGDKLYGSPYTTEQKTIPNYDFVKLAENGAPATGFYTDEPQTVIYQYKGNKIGTVTVTYKNQAGDDLAAPITLKGDFGSNYTAELKTFDHYQIDSLPGNETGTFLTTPQTVALTYTGEDVTGKGDVTVRYVDQNGIQLTNDTITEPIKLTGRYGDHFRTTEEVFPDYNFSQATLNGETTSSPVTGRLNDQPQEVIYKYKGQLAGKLTIEYQNQIGKILKTEEITGSVGDEVTLTPPTEGIFQNYTLNPNQNLTFSLEKQPQTKVIYYTGKVAKPVLEKHIGADGTIFKEEYKRGAFGDAYEFLPLLSTETVGYTFDRLIGSKVGFLTNEEKTVTFIYKKDKIEKGLIKVTYQDEFGKQLALPVTVKGNVGTEYTAKAKKIKGYVANAESQTATYANEETVISFVYTREPVAGANVEVKFVKETGEALAGLSPLTLSGNLGAGYDATSENNEEVQTEIQKAVALGYSVKEIPANVTGTFTNKKQIVVYVFEKGEIPAGAVTINYVDKDTLVEVADSDSLTGTVGAHYQSEAKIIPGYRLVEMPSNASGSFTNATQTVNYQYEKATGGEVTIRFVNEDGVELAEPEKRTGLVGDSIWPENNAKEILGYTVIGSSLQELKGQRFTENNQTLNLTYKFNSTNPDIKPVKVVCIDLYGNILKSNVKVVQSGQTLTVLAPVIEKYTLLGTVSKVTVNWSLGDKDPETIYFTYRGIGSK